MQEGHVHIDQRLARVGHAQVLVVREVADHAGSHILARAEGQECVNVCGRHSQHHTLLGLREPNLPGLQARVFQRHLLQIYRYSRLRANLAHRRGEATGPAVGDPAVEAQVTGMEQHIEQLLLGDRVADLHGAAHLGSGAMGQLNAAKRRAVDTVAPSAPAQHHHRIAGADVVRVGSAWGDAQGAAVDQRIRGVARVEQYRPVDRGDAQLVTIIPYTSHHTGGDPSRGEDTLGRDVIGRAEAEHIGVGDWPRRDAQHIADDPAHAGVRPAEGFQGAGVVMRLYLKRNLVILAEGDDPGIVHEGGEYPAIARNAKCRMQNAKVRLFGVLAQDAISRRYQESLDQAINLNILLQQVICRVKGWIRLFRSIVHFVLCIVHSIPHLRLKRLMATVLAPGLSNRLQLAVAGVAPDLGEVIAHGAHLVEVEGQDTGTADP